MKSWLFSLVMLVLGFIGAPLLPGIINKTKAFFAGRKGQPLLQTYRDLAKLLRKGAVYSSTTTWIFRSAPLIGLVCSFAAMVLLPMAGGSGLLSFAGDLILFSYLLGLMRFFTVAAALDTGSSFEGMGASREVLFSALTEPAMILGLATLLRATGSLSLSGTYVKMTVESWRVAGPAFALVLFALLIVYLTENSRIPIDDPDTHLELTMIHEVMVLDYSGPDLAFVFYSSSLKLWLTGSLVVNLLLSPLKVAPLLTVFAYLGGMVLLAVIVGVLESVMARLSLLKVPQLLLGATTISLLAFTLVVRFLP